nr:acyltransferase domain-containing protein [Rhizobium gallicum]
MHDQALVFAVELSLSALWLSCGIRPAGLVGHSVGEIAAAVTASVLALDEALDLIVARSVEMERVPEKGFMCQVDASAELLRAPLLKFGVEVACKNCLDRTVVAGPEAAFVALEKYCSDNRLRHHRLNVANAFHSEIMAPASEALRDRGPVLAPETPLIPIFPTCSAPTVEPFTRDYWATQMRSCVDFIAAVERVLERIEAPIFLEVGLGQALSTFTRATAGHNAQAAFGVVSGIGGPGNLVAGKIADLFAAGYTVPWHKLNNTERGLLVPMPTYRFSQFEIASTALRMQVTAQYTMSLPPLGRGSIRKTTVFEISPQKTEWLKEHRINGAFVVPGAGILAMIFEFLLDLGPAADNQLNNVVFDAPLVFNTAESRCQIGIQVEDGEHARVALYSRTIGKEDTWTRNAVAVVNSIISWPDDAESCATMQGDKAVASESFYAQFARQGLEYGPHYKRIEGSAHAEKALHARLCSLSNSTGLIGLITALNAMLQAADCAMAVQEQEATFFTASIGSVSLRDAASSANAGTILAWVDGKRHVILCDAVQKPICVMRDVGGSNHRNPIAHGIDTSAAPTDRPVLSKVAQVLGVGSSSLDLNGSLSDNGVDSLQLIELRLALQEISDTYIPLSLLSDGSSLDEIEREFAAMRGGKSPILSVAPVAPAETVEQPRPKIFFVEGIFGYVGGEAGLRDSVKDSIDVIGLGAPGSGNSDNIVAAIRQMADEIELRQPNGPLRLVGHSFGAMLVYSLAVEFGHRGREIEAIVAIDGLLAPALSPHHIPRLDDDDFNQLLHKSRCKLPVPNSTAQTADRAVDELKRVFDKNCRIAASAQIYAPVNYHVTLVLPRQDTVTGITEEVFLQNVGAIQAATSVEDIPSVRVLYVDGDHFSMIRRPAIDEVGRLLVSHASSSGPPYPRRKRDAKVKLGPDNHPSNG